jgi:hypothetical protein
LQQTKILLHREQVRQDREKAQRLSQGHQKQGPQSTTRQVSSQNQFSQTSNVAPQYASSQTQLGQNKGPATQRLPAKNQFNQAPNSAFQNGVPYQIPNGVPNQFPNGVQYQFPNGQITNPPTQQGPSQNQWSQAPHPGHQNNLHQNLFDQFIHSEPQQPPSQGQQKQAPNPANSSLPSQTQSPKAPIQAPFAQNQQVNTTSTKFPQTAKPQPPPTNTPLTAPPQAPSANQIPSPQHQPAPTTLKVSANLFLTTATEIFKVENPLKYLHWSERHIAYDIAATLMLIGIYLDHYSTVNESAAWLEWAFSIQGIWKRRPITSIPNAIPEKESRSFGDVYGDGSVLPMGGGDGGLDLGGKEKQDPK